jgi:hypothetical protein
MEFLASSLDQRNIPVPQFFLPQPLRQLALA